MEGWRSYEKEVLKEYSPLLLQLLTTKGAGAPGPGEKPDLRSPLEKMPGAAYAALEDSGRAAYAALEGSREEYPLATAAAEIILGFVPYVGAAIDTADISAAAARGEYGDATIGAVAYIPGLGDAVKILKRPAVRAALGHGTEAAAAAIAKLLRTDPDFARQLQKVAGDFADDHGVDLLDAGERQMALGNAEQLVSDYIPPDYSEAQAKAATSAATDASADMADAKSNMASDPEGQKRRLAALDAAINTYTAVSGDSLSKIAKEKGFSTEDLIAANPQIEKPGEIDIDQEINLPTAKT